MLPSIIIPTSLPPAKEDESDDDKQIKFRLGPLPIVDTVLEEFERTYYLKVIIGSY